MKTDELINALVADTASVKPPISRTVWAGVAAGLLLASAVFFAAFNVRADFTYAITHHPRYIFKFVFILALAVPALLLVRRLARPDGKAGKLVWALGIGPLLLLVAVLIEMAAVPAAHWGVSALGNMPGACMKYIPLLSLPRSWRRSMSCGKVRRRTLWRRAQQRGCCRPASPRRSMPASAPMTVRCFWRSGMSGRSRSSSRLGR